MRKRAPVVISMALVTAILSMARPTAAADRISLSFVQAPLADVIAAMEDLTGSRILVTPTPSAGDIVTAKMANVTVPEALSSILGVHGYRWEFEGQSLKALGFDGDSGLVVRTVEPGTAAHRAGLKAGDVITNMNGYSIGTRRDALTALNGAASPLKLTVRRGTTEVRLSE